MKNLSNVNISHHLVSDSIINHTPPKRNDTGKEKKEGGPAMQSARAGPPSQPGRMPLSRQLCQLGQYLMHPIPQSLLPPGYILQVGVVNAPGFMRTAGQLV